MDLFFNVTISNMLALSRVQNPPNMNAVTFEAAKRSNSVILVLPSPPGNDKFAITTPKLWQTSIVLLLGTCRRHSCHCRRTPRVN